MDDAFAAVRRDRSRGARSLSLQALTVVDGLLERWRGLSDRWLRSRFRLVAANLTRAQPAMGPFRRWASGWRRMARGSRTGGRLARARAWVRRERERLEEELIGIGRTSRVRFPRAPYVVTLSRSESVLTALRAARGSRRPRRISVLESRPGGEGKAFAADLRRAGLPARTIPDVAFAWGFNSLSSFHRAFAAEFGLSPGDLRGQRPERKPRERRTRPAAPDSRRSKGLEKQRKPHVQ